MWNDNALVWSKVGAGRNSQISPLKLSITSAPPRNTSAQHLHGGITYPPCVCMLLLERPETSPSSPRRCWEAGDVCVIDPEVRESHLKLNTRARPARGPVRAVCLWPGRDPTFSVCPAVSHTSANCNDSVRRSPAGRLNRGRPHPRAGIGTRSIESTTYADIETGTTDATRRNRRGARIEFRAHRHRSAGLPGDPRLQSLRH